MGKIIEQTKDYIILQETMDGLTITIRRWMLRGKFLDWYVDVLVDDSFAKTQGYTSISDMVERTLGKETFDKYCNGIPKWIRAFSNGSFAFMDAERYGHAYMGGDDRVS